jgi:hypothetical protein
MKQTSATTPNRSDQTHIHSPYGKKARIRGSLRADFRFHLEMSVLMSFEVECTKIPLRSRCPGNSLLRGRSWGMGPASLR